MATQAEPGGYDYKWTDDPPDDLKCLICLCVARDPHQHGNGGCGKVFCGSCLHEYKKAFNSCPNCRQLLVTFKDEKSARQNRSLQLRCNNFENGCQWVGELRSLETHITACGFTLLPCPNKCKNKDQIIKVPRINLTFHLTNKCPKRQYMCPHCKETEEYQERTTTHLKVCPLVKVQCPNTSCQVHIPRSKLFAHQSKCNNERVPCKYAGVGCKERVQRRYLQKHEEDNAKEHCALAMTVLTKMVKITPYTFPVNFYSNKLKKNGIFWSRPFYTSYTGYRMSIKVHLKGTDGKSDHISVMAYLMNGDNDDSLTWPFTGTVTVELRNQLGDNNHHRASETFKAQDSASTRVVGKGRALEGLTIGPEIFTRQADCDLKRDKNCQYFRHNMLIFRVCVEH